MARNKKPRKKHNPRQRATDILLGRLILTALESYGKDEDGYGIYRSNMEEDIVQLAISRKRRWCIEAMVVCDPADGTDLYIESEELVTPPIHINDIADEVIGTIERIKKNDCNHNHIVDWGWTARIATPKLLKQLERDET